MVGAVTHAASADLRELASDLAYASGTGIDKAAEDLIRETAMQVQALAIAKVPRRTGKLAASINITWVSKTEAIIGPSLPYGLYVEFGTGSRGEFPGKPYEILPKVKPFLVFKVNGKTIMAKKVRHPGIKAEPFMRPAAMEALEPFTEKLIEKGQLLITKGPRSLL